METSLPRALGIRWTIGAVSPEGFEALQLSVWGARRLFGPEAEYAICVNSLPLDVAAELTGALPGEVCWISASHLLPRWLASHLDRGMAEGVGWKLAPIRVFPGRFELALDNDCILWDVPQALRSALASSEPRCVIAADVRSCFGRFADLCGPEPRNSGIRGTPAEFDLEGALRGLLERRGGVLQSETDEQGLQVAALSLAGRPLVVSVEEVSICSPFPPHTPGVGTCGAHFVGLNAHDLGWYYYDRPASEVRREHWYACRADIYRRLEIDVMHGRRSSAVLRTDACFNRAVQ